MRFTPQQVADQNSRYDANGVTRIRGDTHLAATAPPVEREETLHDEIEAHCRERGWVCVHSRMDRPTTTAKGVCDFIIAAPFGLVWWIECKSRTGKRTPAQIGFAMQLEKLGHRCYEIRSMAEFLEILK